MDLLSDSEIGERLGELDGWERKGEVTITTHSAGGLTASDFELAKKIDAVATG
jgi:pterin-4a-carbinolamine dehydratase